ncbi:uncharacterized protein LOC144626204 [Crassostrea virginica]
MQYTEDNDIPGILMMIDFEKAFDTVSWKFIHKCLDFFNFGSSIKKWISTFQNNIESTVTQSGFLSRFFKPHRGCRQGDPISPYLFLLCAIWHTRLKCKIKNIINQWTKRHTTPIGRISLIKSLLISQMNHLFISLPTPPNKFINDLNNILYNFLWKSKVENK